MSNNLTPVKILDVSLVSDAAEKTVVLKKSEFLSILRDVFASGVQIGQISVHPNDVHLSTSLPKVTPLDDLALKANVEFAVHAVFPSEASAIQYKLSRP